MDASVTDSFEIIEPPLLEATIIESQNETCIVGDDGIATLGVTGGTPGYTYEWTDINAAVIDMDSIASGLSQGDYSAEVTDNNGCTVTVPVTILAPTPPIIDQLLDDAVSCPEDTDGTLTVQATPGSAPIDDPGGYVWSNVKRAKLSQI